MGLCTSCGQELKYLNIHKKDLFTCVSTATTTTTKNFSASCYFTLFTFTSLHSLNWGGKDTHTLSPSVELRFLRIAITENLSWSSHIITLVKKKKDRKGSTYNVNLGRFHFLTDFWSAFKASNIKHPETTRHEKKKQPWIDIAYMSVYIYCTVIESSWEIIWEKYFGLEICDSVWRKVLEILQTSTTIWAMWW